MGVICSKEPLKYCLKASFLIKKPYYKVSRKIFDEFLKSDVAQKTHSIVSLKKCYPQNLGIFLGIGDEIHE